MCIAYFLYSCFEKQINNIWKIHQNYCLCTKTFNMSKQSNVNMYEMFKAKRKLSKKHTQQIIKFITEYNSNQYSVAYLVHQSERCLMSEFTKGHRITIFFFW
jgi:hypothetical protein